ncbi:MAG: hypothetical protein EOR47_22640 [Mesorhizobium sp.]|nr:MAG: hypothetical protein EOR47_22640 [Mesorhizobium sp.]
MVASIARGIHSRSHHAPPCPAWPSPAPPIGSR